MHILSRDYLEGVPCIDKLFAYVFIDIVRTFQPDES
jgi:hypothetical protein